MLYYIGDVGTIITVDCGQDISSASVLELHCLKPDGATEVIWTGTLYQTNYIRYTTDATTWVDGDEGTWKLQAYVELPGGKWRGDTVDFKVKAHYTK